MIGHESSRRIKALNVQGVLTGTFATSSLFWFLLKPILNRTQGGSESQPLAKHKLQWLGCRTNFYLVPTEEQKCPDAVLRPGESRELACDSLSHTTRTVASPLRTRARVSRGGAEYLEFTLSPVMCGYLLRLGALLFCHLPPRLLSSQGFLATGRTLLAQ